MELQQSLENVLNTLQQLGLAYATDSAKKTDAVNSERLVKELESVKVSADQTSEIKVPIDLLKFLDDGRSPELFIQETINFARQNDLRLNEQSKRFAELRTKLNAGKKKN